MKTIITTKNYLYRCQQSNELRGKRLSSNPDSKGRLRKQSCGFYNIHRTKRVITPRSSHQAECPRCGKRTRLNEANAVLYDNEAECMRKVARLNRAIRGEEE